MLVTFIVLYLLGSVAIGLFAATRVHNTADYAVAGRSLPLAVVIATTFATWFGSETVLGVSARFIDGGLGRGHAVIRRGFIDLAIDRHRVFVFSQRFETIGQKQIGQG